MLTILSMLAMGAAELQNFRELMYDKRYDLPSEATRNRPSGTVQSLSRLQITILTAGKVPELKSFPTHRRLSQGLISYRANDPMAYTISDIRPGDVVTLYICQEEKAEYCYAISPSRRPGGLVPESRTPKHFRSYAEDANTVNAFNDTGRKIPRHFDAGVRSSEYPFANPFVPKGKWLKRFPHDYPFSYMEYLIFMR